MTWYVVYYVDGRLSIPRCNGSSSCQTILFPLIINFKSNLTKFLTSFLGSNFGGHVNSIAPAYARLCTNSLAFESFDISSSVKKIFNWRLKAEHIKKCVVWFRKLYVFSHKPVYDKISKANYNYILKIFWWYFIDCKKRF